MTPPSTPRRPRRSLVRLDPPIGLPHHPLGDANRLWSAHLAPPSHHRRWLATKQTQVTRPLGSTPITGASSLLRGGPPLCPTSVRSPLQVRCLGISLSRLPATPSSRRVEVTGSHVPHKRLKPRSRHLHAGHHLASQPAPARLIPEQLLDPGFDVITAVSTRHQWFASARLRDSHLTRSRARRFRNAHHPGS
jgi:hypothetical protein